MTKREKRELTNKVSQYRSLEEERRIYKYSSVIWAAKRIVEVLNAFEGKNELGSATGRALDGPTALTNFVQLARELRKNLK